jgi:hypothetical protein
VIEEELGQHFGGEVEICPQGPEEVNGQRLTREQVALKAIHIDQGTGFPGGGQLVGGCLRGRGEEVLARRRSVGRKSPRQLQVANVDAQRAGCPCHLAEPGSRCQWLSARSTRRAASDRSHAFARALAPGGVGTCQETTVGRRRQMQLPGGQQGAEVGGGLGSTRHVHYLD